MARIKHLKSDAAVLLLIAAGLTLTSTALGRPEGVRDLRPHKPASQRREAFRPHMPFSPRTGAAGQDRYAQALLRQMLQAEQQVALAGDQFTILVRDGQPVTSEQHVLRDGTRAFRLEYVQPPNLSGELIIDDGHTFWHYSPSTKKLEVGGSRINRLRGRVPEVMTQIKRGSLEAHYLGQDVMAGRSCGVVEVFSRDLTQGPRRRFWIDPTNGAQLRIDQFGADGQMLSSSYYSGISYNPALGPDAFRPPVTPPGARQVGHEPGTASLTIPQAQALTDFPIQQPTYLPPGFHFQAASVSEFHRKKLIALRYVNGLNVLSLFETSLDPRVAAQPAQITHPRPGVLNLFQNGLRFILVGNIAPSEMEKILVSVH